MTPYDISVETIDNAPVVTIRGCPDDATAQYLADRVAVALMAHYAEELMEMEAEGTA